MTRRRQRRKQRDRSQKDALLIPTPSSSPSRTKLKVVKKKGLFRRRSGWAHLFKSSLHKMWFADEQQAFFCGLVWWIAYADRYASGSLCHHFTTKLCPNYYLRGWTRASWNPRRIGGFAYRCIGVPSDWGREQRSTISEPGCSTHSYRPRWLQLLLQVTGWGGPVALLYLISTR